MIFGKYGVHVNLTSNRWSNESMNSKTLNVKINKYGTEELDRSRWSQST